MKIAITAKEKNLESEIDPRFGRCRYFIIVDTESMDFDILSNDSALVSGGAGIKAAQTIARSGIKVVVTGNIGPNAYNTLSAAGIKIFTGAFGTIKEVVDKYKKGILDETTSANVNSHFGIKSNNLDFGRGKEI